jgi:ferredoxin
MVVRQIIKIDEELCTGCGNCIPGCPEGALQIIDDKARLISDLFCDGLGACIGECPEGAIAVEEREAEDYEEKTVMANIVKAGANTIKAHLVHLKEHNQDEYLQQALDYLRENNIDVPEGFEDTSCVDPGHGEKTLACGCPGSMMMDLKAEEEVCVEEVKKVMPQAESQLRQWPVQIHLVPPMAPYLNNSDLLIAADCVPFAFPNFHEELLKGKILLIGCPKLDDVNLYKNKFVEIFKTNDLKSLTIAHMEVPCCFGLIHLINQAMKESGKDIPVKSYTIGVQGDITEDQ